MRRRLLGVLGGLMLVGVLVTPASATTTWQEQYSTSIYSKCTGDTITLTGPAVTVVRPNGLLMSFHLNGTGSPSGAEYVYNSVIVEKIDAGVGYAATIDAREHMMLVGKGTTPNEAAIITIHQEVDSAGALISITWNITDDCQGG